MKEDRFNKFKKTIINKDYGQYWSEAKNTFMIDFVNGNFLNKGKRNYFPDIYNPDLNEANLLDVNLNNKENKKIFKLGKKKLCLNKNTKNRTLIYSQYYVNSIDKYLNEKNVVCEIGSGSGLFSALIHERKKTTNILVDIPEVLLTAISLLFTLFPDKNFLLPNEIDKSSLSIDFSKYDFVFLTPDLINYIGDESINFGINTQSFMEMDMDEVDRYLKFLDKKISNNGYFFCSNRIRKRHYFFDYKFYLLNKFEKVFLKKNEFFYSNPKSSSMLDFLLKKNLDTNKKSISFNFYEKLYILTKFKKKELFSWIKKDIRKLLSFYKKRIL